MTADQRIPLSKDKLLLTPGPLTTSMMTKQAMLNDYGSRDHFFIKTVQEIRHELLRIAGVSQQDGYEAVPMQGSGTFGIESVVTCSVPPDGKWLVVINGAYGERIVKIAETNKIPVDVLRYPENSLPVLEDIDQKLSGDPEITSVAIVHCETTTGILNPVEDVGRIVKAHGKSYFIDSMSAFGAVPFDMRACGADYLVSSANKCIESVPGFSFVICRRESIEESAGWSRTLCLDLHAQWKGLEKNGQFRFTPPTHAILAFRQALKELEMEGGVAGRAARYRQNYETLVAGMRSLGFCEYLDRELQGYIITSFRYPENPKFDFGEFYSYLSSLGFVIYPGKVSSADCFRIGTIGRIFPEDIKALVSAVEYTLEKMDVRL